MRLSILMPVGIAFLVVSCADKPLVQPRPITLQKKLETSAHWKELASKNAQQLSSALKNIPDPMPGGHIIEGKRRINATLSSRPHYVVALNSSAPFGRAYHDFLIEELNKSNHTIATNAQNATVINVRVQVLEYNGPSRARTIPGLFGIGSALGYYGYQSSKWSSTSTTLLANIGVGTVLDTYLFMTDTPNAEVVVTTAVVGENNYYYLKTDRYYVDLENAGVYKSIFGPAPFVITRSMPVTNLRTVKIPLSRD